MTARQGANLVEATEFVTAALMADLPVGTGKAVEIAGAMQLHSSMSTVPCTPWTIGTSTKEHRLPYGQLAGADRQKQEWSTEL